jgi:lauroyl/myristoyl acyltransferase
MAEVLRANEVIWIPIDTPLLDPKDQARTIQVDFLGRQARLLPGSIQIAKRTGAAVLVGVVRRSADWRHQVLEISPPVPVDGDIATAFRSCVAKVEAPMYQNLAHWVFWESRQALVNLGLVPGEVVKRRLGVRFPAHGKGRSTRHAQP